MSSRTDQLHTNKSWKITHDKEQTNNLRKKYIGPSVQTFFRQDPLKIVRAAGQYMYDESGRRYLDCINNVSHVGHCHPVVVEACTDQMSLLNTNCRFLHDNMVNLAERITSTLPRELSVCYFVNSGSEANDLAMRLSRYYTKNKDAIVLDHAYHGHLISTMSISPYKFNQPNCEDDKPDWVHVVPSPDSYRGKYRDDQYSPDQLANLYANEVKVVCDELAANGKSPAVMYVESMQGCAGQVIYPTNYLRLVIGLIHQAGGVVVADEVQTGFGRIGSHMWAFQVDGEDIVPDIVVIGKAMGNGHPVAAVVVNREIAEAFSRGPQYFNTFGGNPVSCAVSLAVLDVIENEGLMKNAVLVGDHMVTNLRELQTRHPLIGDIRGSGMFIGIDLVRSLRTREPAVTEAQAVLWGLRESGVLLSLDGPHDNILKFKPPMCFTLTDADFLLAALDRVIGSVELQYEYITSSISSLSVSSPCHSTAPTEQLSGHDESPVTPATHDSVTCSS